MAEKLDIKTNRQKTDGQTNSQTEKQCSLKPLDLIPSGQKCIDTPPVSWAAVVKKSHFLLRLVHLNHLIV